MTGIFAQALRGCEPSEPTDSPLIKQCGQYEHYPYKEMMRPRPTPAHSRAIPAIPIGMWFKLPPAA